MHDSEPLAALDLRDVSVVVVPGLGGSGVTHWQTFWERCNEGWIRCEQDDWDRPERDAWVRRLSETVHAASNPVVLVGHSMGCATIAHAAHDGLLGKVVAAFLVAMPDLDRDDFPHGTCRGFAPLPPSSLPFPSVVIGSTDDPWTTSERLAHWARVFGARYREVGARHHIGTAAGLGAWGEGYALFGEFLRERGIKES